MRHGSRFNPREVISTPGGTCNEDRAGWSTSGAWVLDGATGLNEHRILPGPSDAAWLVTEIDNFFKQKAEFIYIPRIMEELANFIQELFQITSIPADFPIIAHEPPSASLSLAALREDRLTLANVGDCRAFFKAPGQDLVKFGSSRVSALDHEVIKELVILQSKREVSYKELWDQIVPLIKANRQLKNTPNGYWVVDPSNRWISHVEYTEFNVSSGGILLIVSDGFYRLVDHYGIYTSDEMLFESSIKYGLKTLESAIRQIEGADEDCISFPRLKSRDDATALLIEILI